MVKLHMVLGGHRLRSTSATSGTTERVVGSATSVRPRTPIIITPIKDDQGSSSQDSENQPGTSGTPAVRGLLEQFEGINNCKL